MTRHVRVLARPFLVALALGVVTLVVTAEPADAHGLGGVQPTNYRTEVSALVPSVRGIELGSVDLGARLELRNSTRHDVIVLGYEGEPYLRVGPAGVFENVHSPATYLNVSATNPPRTLPRTADPSAPPKWRRVSSGDTARWHDHRSHWMGKSDPPVVQRDRGERHLIQRFTIRLRVDGRTLRAAGSVVWEPGPSPWPWLAGAGALLVAGIFLGRGRRWVTALGVGLAILVVAEVVHVVGSWDATTRSGWSQLAGSAYSLGGLALAGLAIDRLVRKGGYAAVPYALCAGLFLAIAGGLADLTTLSRSQLPTTLPDWLTRLAVALVLGVGAAVAAIAALRLRTPAAGVGRRKSRGRTRTTTTETAATPAPEPDPGGPSPGAPVPAPSLRDALQERSRAGS